MKYEIKTIPVGDLQTNCYLLIPHSCSDGKAVIIDPGSEAEKIIRALDSHNPDAILLTHAHADHIGAVAALKKKFPSVSILSHSLEFPALGDPSKNLSLFEGLRIISPPADKTIEDGAVISSGENIKLKVISTPGHTSGSVCFLDEENKIIFTGDTIFRETIGRVDLPSGSEEAMLKSIAKFLKLAQRFGDLLIYPGHGPATTLSNEKRRNPYFRVSL